MDPEDPLAAAMAPPPGETGEERVVRLRREAEAKRVNDEIEERIKQDRAAWKTHKNMFKLLLLGQSESGTSPSRLIPFSSLDSVPILGSCRSIATGCGGGFHSARDGYFEVEIYGRTCGEVFLCATAYVR